MAIKKGPMLFKEFLALLKTDDAIDQWNKHRKTISAAKAPLKTAQKLLKTPRGSKHKTR